MTSLVFGRRAMVADACRRVSPAAFLVLVCAILSADGARVYRHAGDSAMQTVGTGGDIKVKMWTWNSPKKELQQEADRIFDTDADLIVTCQTEAKKPIYQFANISSSSRWWHIAHGQHAGIAGGSKNFQYMDVFLRKPSENKYTIQSAAEDTWKLESSNMLRGQDRAMHWSNIPGLVKAHSAVHQTSSTGKGGASATVTFAPTNERDGTTVAFLCAHLDAFEDAKRLKGLVSMFSELRPDIELHNTVLEAAPCALFDANSQACLDKVQNASRSADMKEKRRPEVDAWLKARGNALARKIDSIVILGDLNYRVKQMPSINGTAFELTDISLLARSLLSPSGRELLETYDPLNSNSGYKAQLVQTAADGGFAFTCNSPLRHYPPTYKLLSEEKCAELAQRMETTPDAVDDLIDLLKQCYTKDPHPGGILKKAKEDWAWDTKGKDLQMGWLDRFCYRAVEDSPVQHRFVMEEGWTKTMGSDHMAAAVEMVVSNPLVCGLQHVQQPSHSSIAASDRLIKNEVTQLSCEEGYLLATQHDQLFGDDGEGLRQATIRCDADLRLIMDDDKGIPVDQLQCLRYCGPYELPAGSSVKMYHAGGIAGLQGSTVQFKPANRQVLLGSRTAVCSDDGQYTHSGAPPVSTNFCKLDGMDTYLTASKLTVRGETNLPSSFDTSLYQDEVSKCMPSNPKREYVLQGTQFELACVDESAVILGGKLLTCNSTTQFTEELVHTKCAASARFRVIAVDMGNIIPSSEVNYFKVKLFRSSASVKKKKAYELQAKVKPNELGSESAELTTTELDDIFLHMTVCAAKGTKEQALSNCKVGATTLEPSKCQDCNVARLLQKAGSQLKPVTVSLPIDLRKGYSSVSTQSDGPVEDQFVAKLNVTLRFLSS